MTKEEAIKKYLIKREKGNFYVYVKNDYSLSNIYKRKFDKWLYEGNYFKTFDSVVQFLEAFEYVGNAI